MAGGGNPTNVYQGAAQGLTQAGQTAANVAQFQPQSVTANLGQYQNPYTSQVTDAALADVERQRQLAINDVGASATRAGAYGGSRHGVAEALTNEAAMRQAGQLSANLNSQGFGQAANLAQQDIANQMSAGGLNLNAASTLGDMSNLGFGMGQSIADQQMRQGTMQQGLTQQLIDAAKGQFNQFTSSPTTSAMLPLQTIGSVPYGQTQQTTQNPGLFNYLSLGLGLL